MHTLIRKKGTIQSLFCLFFAAAMLTVHGCGGSSGSSDGGMQSDSIIAGNAKELDATTLQNLVSISSDGSTLTFTGDAAQARSLSNGDVIVAGVSSATPYGSLRKVNTVSASDDQIVVQTQQASITDAVTRGSVDITQTLRSDNIQYAVALAKGVSFQETTSFLGLDAGALHITVDHVVLYSIPSTTSSTTAQVVANGSVSLHPSFTLRMAIDSGTVRSLTFSNTTTAQTQLDITSTVDGNLSSVIQIAHYTFQPITVMVGRLPVVLTPVLTVNVSGNGTVSYGLTAGVTQDATLTGGLSYDNGSWTSVGDYTKNFQTDPPTAHANAALKAALGPELDIMLYGVVGLKTVLSGYLEFNVALLNSPWWQLHAGIDVTASVDAAVLDSALGDFSKKVIGLKTLVVQSTGVYVDDISPAVPAGLTAVASISEMSLAWTASSDNIGVVGYRIYRDGGTTPIKTVMGTSTTDSGLSTATLYCYSVSAVDAAGNESAKSVPQCATTGGSPMGTIAGSVKDAGTDAMLSGVTVAVSLGEASIASGVTASNGSFSILVPVGSGYEVAFSKSGYVTMPYFNINCEQNMTTYLESVLLQGTSGISGTIVNAVTGTGVSGLAISLREGINIKTGTIVTATTTGADGAYSLSDLSEGNYTAEVSGSGYITTYFAVVCNGGTITANQNASVTPILPADEIRIVLTWGAAPSDLDAHMTGPLDGSADRFHVYSSNTGSATASPYTTLDLDDTSSYGPETITVYHQTTGVYRYSVHDFTNRSSTSSMALAGSGAQVNVYQGANMIATFNVPAGQGGNLWTVFEMEGGVITPKNTMSYVSASSSVPAPSMRKTGTNDALLLINLTGK